MYAPIINKSKDGDKFLILDCNVSVGIVPFKEGFSVGDFISCEIRSQDDDIENHDSYEIISYEKISADDVTPSFKKALLLDEDVIDGAKFHFD